MIIPWYLTINPRKKKKKLIIEIESHPLETNKYVNLNLPSGKDRSTRNLLIHVMNGRAFHRIDPESMMNRLSTYIYIYRTKRKRGQTVEEKRIVNNPVHRFTTSVQQRTLIQANSLLLPPPFFLESSLFSSWLTSMNESLRDARTTERHYQWIYLLRSCTRKRTT